MTDDHSTPSLTWVQGSLYAQGRSLDVLLREMDSLSIFFPEAETTDEALLFCYLYTLILWLQGQEDDLEVLLKKIERPLLPEAYRDTFARMTRCVEVDRLLVMQGELMQAALLRPGADIHFHLLPRRAHTVRSFSRVGILTLHLESLLDQLHLERQGEGDDTEEQVRLVQSFREDTRRHQNCLQVIQQHLSALIGVLSAIPSPRGVALDELVPDNLLSHVELATGLRCEPGKEELQRVEDDYSRGIVVLQSLAIWFSALSSAYQQAINHLRAKPARIKEARDLIRRMAAVLRLFTYMLDMPHRELPPDEQGEPQAEIQLGSFFASVLAQAHQKEDSYLWDTSLLRTCVKQVLARQGVRLSDDDVRQRGRNARSHQMGQGQRSQAPEEELASLAEALQELDSSEKRWWSAAEKLLTARA